MEFTKVSVPFRGSCSEIPWTIISFNISPKTFPSPFGVHVLKFQVQLVEQDEEHAVSVPFRGSCSEITRRLYTMAKTRFCFRPLSGFMF